MRSLLWLALLPIAPPRPVLTIQSPGTTALLQAVSAIDSRTVWLSGHAGTFARSTDGGTTWLTSVIAGSASMQWRDVHAESATHAWVMGAGNGPASAIHATTDGGRSWRVQQQNTDSAAFYDCMAFWPGRRGFVFSDAVRGRLPYVSTDDGLRWTTDAVRLPAALEGEGGFAASGTCALTVGTSHGWIATGSAAPRVHRTTDGGRSWRAAEVPLLRGGASGGAALAFRDSVHGVVLGGSIDGKASGPRVAVTDDGGTAWRVTGEPPLAGAIYGAAYAHVGTAWVLVAVGPGGAAYSHDDGATWTALAEGPFWSVGFAPDGTGWMTGPRGRVVRVQWA